jgi:hypothetical protein
MNINIIQVTEGMCLQTNEQLKQSANKYSMEFNINHFVVAYFHEF